MIRKLAGWISALAAGCAIAHAEPSHQSFEFVLENGLQVVLLPDTRSSAVTHILGYRVGSADEEPGKSGLAHFVEHLMFKSTRTKKTGEFAGLVASVGGIENAMTTRDATIFYQRVTKPLLPEVMAFEADRMANLVFDPAEAAAELEVVLAERRSRIDGSPFNLLSVEMDRALYAGHPYQVPSIGWSSEIAALTAQDARAFYERNYRPDNAFVVIAGDLTLDEVRRFARETYGRVAAPQSKLTRTAAPPRDRTINNELVEVRDRRVSGASLYRIYRVPSSAQAAGLQAESLELLLAILARGETSRLGRNLVLESGAARSVDGGYKGLNRLGGDVAIFVSGGDALPAADIGRAITSAIDEIARSGVTEAELERARALLSAKRSYDWDSQLRKARGYADALAAGQTPAGIEGWAERLRAVSIADIMAAARLLDAHQSVTGLLLPEPAPPAAATSSCTGRLSC